jgi:hypothetical protein
VRKYTSNRIAKGREEAVWIPRGRALNNGNGKCKGPGAGRLKGQEGSQSCWNLVSQGEVEEDSICKALCSFWDIVHFS